MKPNDDLEQKLWELEYGLLADDEAAAFRQQVASQSDWAHTQDRVRADIALVAEAAQVRLPPLKLPRGGDGQERVAQVAPPPRSGLAGQFIVRRAMNWAVSAAALLLVAAVGYATLSMRWPREVANVAMPTESMARQAGAETVREQMETTSVADRSVPLRLDVLAAPKVYRGAAPSYFIQTSTPGGAPEPARVAVEFQSSDGRLNYRQFVATDRAGRAQFSWPEGAPVATGKLLFAAAGGKPGSVDVPLTVTDDRYQTYVTTDRPVYAPGDVVRYRAVTLSRFSWTADRDIEVRFQVTDPAGTAILSGESSGTTRRGVSGGEWTVPRQAAAGRYTLWASHPGGLFPDVKQDFSVFPHTARTWKPVVQWRASEYRAGDVAVATVTVRSAADQPAAGVPLQLEAYVDGHRIEATSGDGVTDASGQREVSVVLPDTIAFGDAVLRVVPGEDEPLAERIPLRVDRLAVEFFPEGGELAAGVENRVYFAGHDLLGRATAFRGELISARGEPVATLVAQHEGRGSFRLTPQAGETYTVRISEPAAVGTDSRLPPAADRVSVAMDCGAGVFAGDQPLVLRLRSRAPPPQLVIAVSCRGSLVAQTLVNQTEFADGECETTLPIRPEVAGVLRVTVVDGEEPLAERLVFREPARRVQLQVDGLRDQYAAGEPVRLSLRSVDETGAGMSAVLGVRVIDDLLWTLARPTAPRQATHFWLLGDVDSPEKLEDANFFVANSPDSRRALDLLLGTQGWRRFRPLPGTDFAQTDLGARDAFVLQQSSRRSGLQRGGGAGAGDLAYSKAKADLTSDRLADISGELPVRFDNELQLAPALAALDSRTGKSELSELPDLKVPVESESIQPGLGDSVEITPSAVPAVTNATRTILPWLLVVLASAMLLVLAVVSWSMRLAANRYLVLGGSLLAAVAILLALFQVARSSWVMRSRIEVAMESATAEHREARKFAMPVAPPAADEAAPRMNEASSEPAVGQPHPVPPPPLPQFGGTAAGGAAATEGSRPRQPGSGPRSAEKSLPRQLVEGPGIASAPAETVPSPAGLAPALKAMAPAAPASAAGRMPAVRQPQLELETEVQRRLQGVPRFEAPIADKNTERLSAGARPGATGSALAGAESANLTNPRPTLVLREYAHQRRRELLQPAEDKSTATLYWHPLLVTDANGTSEVGFDLPETAGRYRLTIDAHQDGRLGGESRVITVQP